MQDAHPFDFFINEDNGKVTILDLDDMSWDIRMADISNVWLFKIVRGYVNQNISKEEAIAQIAAFFKGLNEGGHATHR